MGTGDGREMMILATTSPDRWVYIWSSYGVFVLVFVALMVAPIVWRSKLIGRLKQYYKRKQLLDRSNK